MFVFRRIWPLALVAATLGIIGARAQNFDEGKTGSELFALDCSACHKTPQGLAKSRSGGALTGFLRQHYTSSSQSAAVLSAYLSNPAANPRADRPKGRSPEEDGKASQKKQAARPPETPDHNAKSTKRNEDQAGKASKKSRPPATAARPPEPTPEPPETPNSEPPAIISEPPAPPAPPPSSEPPPTTLAAPAVPPAAAEPPPAAAADVPKPPTVEVPPTPAKVPDQPSFSAPLP